MTDREAEPGRFERAMQLGTRVVETALRMFGGESVRLRAMALTYITLFALVPGLVVAFSVVQAFTGMEAIGERVHEFLFENLAVGAQATIAPYLDKFVRNAHLTSAGLVGGALLAWSAVSLLQNVDRAINDIWGIKRRRPIAQQAVIYWVGLTLGPLLLAGSVMATATTRSFLHGTGLRFLAVAASALLTSTFFSVLFLIVPNTRVRLRAAVAGGFVSGIAWEIAKWAYAVLVAKFFRYHAIYGSIAAVPIFLLWLFLSWTIVLFGARLAFVVQYAAALLRGTPHAASKSGLEILAGHALLRIARAYDRGEEAPDAGEVATALPSTAEEAGEAVAALRQAGLVVALADGGLVPSRPLEKLTLLDVRRAVAGAGPEAFGSSGVVAGVVREVESEAASRLSEATLRWLCDRDRGDAQEVRSGAPEEGGPAAARPVSSA